MLLKKESHLYSFLFMKCPHCHTGDMFIDKNPYNLKYLSKMPEQCPKCSQSFFPEVGFYWGAMYMSYGLTVFSSVINVLLIGYFSNWNLLLMVLGNTAILLLSNPVFYRYARVLWLQVNTPFSKEELEKAKHNPD
jgi:hypothetical protein